MANSMIVADAVIPVDKEGYLKNLDDWNIQVADVLAANEGIQLSEAHWDVINILRDFFVKSGLSPGMRILVKLMKKSFTADKANSLYLLTLFPGNPAILASKIAGLPRPTHCL